MPGMYLRIKIVIIGDEGVGKTTFARGYFEGFFSCEYKYTTGADYYMKEEEFFFDEFGSVKCRLDAFELAAGQQFLDSRRVYYTRSKVAIIVFDVSRPDTFNSISEWLKEFWTCSGGINPFIIVGNKIDLRDTLPCLETKHGEEYAKKLSTELGFPVPYVEISAISGGYSDRIHNALKTAIHILLIKYIQKQHRVLGDRQKQKEGP